MSRLGEQLLKDKHLDEAETLAREAVAQATRLVGPTHPDVFNYRHLLASVLQAKSQYAAAEAEFKAVIEGASAKLGAGHTDVAYYRISLASLWEKTGRLKEAAAAYRVSFEQLQRTLGDEAPRTQSAMAGMYRVAAALRKQPASAGH